MISHVCNWHQKSRALHLVYIRKEKTGELGSYGRVVAKIVCENT